jgi:hypothetical protein
MDNILSVGECIASLPIVEDCKTSSDGSFYVVTMNKVVSETDTSTTSTTLTGVVWQDTNTNGVQDFGETIFIDIKVTLISTTTGEVIMTTITDASGSWTFTQVVIGTYIIRLDLPTGFVLVSTETNEETVTVSSDTMSSESSMSIKTAVKTVTNFVTTIIGVVWVDFTGAGIRTSSDNGLPNVAVTLAYTNRTVIATTTTDSFGVYNFTAPFWVPCEVIVTNPNPNVFNFLGDENAPDNKANSSGVIGNVYVSADKNTLPAPVALVVKPGVKCAPTTSNDLKSAGGFSTTSGC